MVKLKLLPPQGIAVALVPPPAPPAGPSPGCARGCGVEADGSYFPPTPPLKPPGRGIDRRRASRMGAAGDPAAPEISIVPSISTSPLANQITGAVTALPGI